MKGDLLVEYPNLSEVDTLLIDVGPPVSQELGDL
jgi:hypothetical protein